MFRCRLGFVPSLVLILAGSSALGAQVGNRVPPVGGFATGLPGNVIKTVTDLNGGTVLPGDTLVYDVTLTNAGGPDDALQLALIDSIPLNTTFASGSLVITSGPNAGAKTDATGDDQAFYESTFNRVRFRLGTGATATLNGTLAANATTSVQFRVVVNAGVVSGTVISNSAQVRYRDGGTNAETATASRPPGGPIGGTPTTVTVEIPDLTIAKSHTGSFVRGAIGTYSLVVSNAGPGATAGTHSVSDVVPAGLTPTLATGTGWSCSIVAQTVTCSRTAALAAGASAPAITLTVAVSTSAASSITNTATVAGGGETNAGNNSASDPTTVVDPPIDLSITKSHVGNFVAIQQGTFTLTVTNQTVATGSGPITVTDTLPNGLTFVSGTGSGWSCAAGGQVVTCSHPGPIGPNASTTISLTVDVGAAAFPGFTNRAWVSHPGDAVAANDVASDAVIVESIPDYSITKTAGGAFLVGSQATYILGITNIATGPSFGITTVTDTLPTGLTFVSATGTGWTCGAVGQVMTCTQPPGVPSGAIIPITLTVNVGAGAAPSVTNRVHIASPGDVNQPNNTASVTTPVTNPSGADLTITKTHTGNFTVGTNGVYTLRVTNSGSSVFLGTFTIVDTLPAGLTFVSGPPPCPAVGQVITCTVTTTLNPGGSTQANITVAVGAAAFPAVTNRAHVASAGDGNPNNNSATDPTTVVSNIDLSITKTAASAFTVGANASYTLQVTNVGTAATLGTITVTDTLPAGLAFQSGTGTGWSCSAAGQVVTCTNPGPLAAAASSTITLGVAVSAPAAPSVTNTAHVATPADAVSGNNSSTVVTPVGAAPASDLTLAKTATSAFVVGSNATYSLVVNNAGSAATTGAITVTDTLPTGLTFSSGTGTGWSCAAAGQVVTCTNAGPIGAGLSSTITLTVGVSAPAAPSVTNTAHVATPGEGNPNNNSGSVTTPVSTPSGADLTITKTHTGNFTVGVNGQYSLRVTNSGTASFTGTFTIVDTLPAGLTFVSGPPPCPAVGQVITCTLTATLAPGAQTVGVITVAVGGAAAPSVTNRAHVSAAGDSNANNNSASDPTTVLSIPDLALTKTATSTFTVGSNATYDLVVTNVSSGSTTGALTITDTLPTGLSFVSGTGTGWSCSAAGQVVTCTNPGPLASAATSTVVLTVGVGAGAAPSVTNVAHINTPGDFNTTNNAGTAVTPVVVPGAPNLSLTKSHSGNFVVGQNGVYTITVSNVGTASTTGSISVADTLPAGLSFVSGTGTGWSCSAAGQVVTCTNPGPLATSASSSIALTVGVAAAALPSVTNRATVTTPGDADQSNDVGSDPTTVVAVDLALTKTATSAFTVGSNATYALAVSNVSTIATTGTLTVTDTLPTGLTFSSGTGTGWSCSAAGQVVTCTNPGPLAASASTTITLTVSVGAPAAPSVTNRAHIATPGDVNTANDMGTAVTPVTVPGTPNLSLTKSHTGAFVVGQQGSYTLAVSNVGSGATTGTITVSDTLPNGLTFASGTGSGWSCSTIGQIVTCTNPGPLAAAASTSITLTVNVSAAALPSVTNRATVGTPGDTDPSNDVGSDPTTVVSIPDLTIAKVATSTFTVGSNATYQLTVTNVSSGSTTGAITVTDILPAGLTFVSGTGSGWSCGAVGQTVTCTNAGPLGAAAATSITLTVAVTAPASPSVSNTATVQTPGDANGANDSSTAVTPVASPTLDLAITKTLNGSLVAGQNATYTLLVSNTSSQSTSGAVTVTDVLPTGLTPVSATGTGVTCTTIGQTVTCTRAALLAGGQSFTITLVAAVSPAATGTITNTATVNTAGDTNPGNNSASATATVGSGVDLALTKSASALVVGNTGTFTITVSNVGSSPTTGLITVTDNLPAGLTYISGSGGGFTCTVVGSLVTCTRSAVLAVGQSEVITLVVNVSSAALPSITNTATVSTPGDGVVGNNTGSTGTVAVTAPGADLALTKTLITPPIAGAQATFRLTVTNVGGGAASGPITVTDVLQSGLAFVSANAAGWSCSAAGQTVTCTAPGPMAPGATSTIDLVVAIGSGVASISNTATVVAPGDANPGNNSGSISPTPTTLPPDLTVTKVANGPFVVGQPAGYTVTVRNSGSGLTSGTITVTDVVPAGLTVTGASGSGWSCSVGGQTVTCTHPGPLAPNGTLSLTIAVVPTAAAVPAVTNRVTVATPGDANPANNDGTVTTPVTGVLDLALTKQGADTVVVGAPTSYTLAVRNVGTVPTTAPITVTDSLPAGLTFVSGTGPGFTCSASGQIVTCTRTAPPLGVGESATLTVTATVAADAPASVRNVACVRTAGDTNTANDCGTKVSSPLGDVDLVALKDVVGPVEVGRPATFTLAVRNIGTAPARPPITMVDTLPNGLTFVSATGAGWQCGAAGNIVTCIRPTALPPGLSPAVTLTVNVTAAAFPRVTNCLSVRGTNETGSLANNRMCSDPVVAGLGKLEIEKRVARAEVQVGDVVDYSVVVKNTGFGEVPDAIVSDILPPGFLLETQSVRVNGAGGVVVTGQPGPQLTFEIGRVPANGQVTLTYRVRVGPGARTGQQTNVAVAASKSRGGETAPARAIVKVSGGVFDERGAIVGKVYIDCHCNRDLMQGEGEVGIPGVRVYLEDGTSSVTDVEGKYNFYNVSSRLHIVKVDRTTLPVGAELIPLVNRNAGDGYTRFADVKAGELHRADFADGSRSPEVLKAVLARRRTGEVNNAGEPAREVVGYAPRNAVKDQELTQESPDATQTARDAEGIRRGLVTTTDSLVAIPSPMRAYSGVLVTTMEEARRRPIEQTWTRRYAPLFRGSVLNEANSQLPVTPLRARALQEGTSPANRGMVELRVGTSLANQGVPADGQTGTTIVVRALDMQGNPRPGRTVVTLEASLGRWLANDVGSTEQGMQAVLENGEGMFTLIAAPQPGVGEVRATTPDASTTVQLAFVPVNRPLLVTGLVAARVDWQKLLNGGLGLSARSDGFDEALKHWSTGDDSSAMRAGIRTQLFMKGTVLDNRLLTLAYDSERERGRTFFRDIAPNEFFPVYGDASMREFDAQSRRRFYARLDKGTGYTMYGDFQTTRADDRRVLTAYDRSLTGAVHHIEGRDGSATFFASQGRISQQVDEIPGRGISGPYALSRSSGLINSERVEILVRDRNQPSVILSRTAMTRFADYTIEPVTGRIVFRAPVQSLDANLNPVSIRVTYETEDGRSKAFWIYGVDGAVRAGKRLELGATVARDEGPTSGNALYGVNATAKLGNNTTVFGELGWTRPEGGLTGDAQRVELRHQSATLEGRLFAVRSDAGYANLSSVFTGGRAEVGGRFSKQLATGTRLVAEGLRSQYGSDGARREGALLAIERQFSQALRGEFGYRYARTNEPETTTGVVVPGTPTDDRDVSALRARLQYTLPQNTRTSVFGEVEQDVRDSDRRRLAVGGEYIIANRARLYGRHEMLSGFRDQFAPAFGKDRNYTVFGVDADYLKNTQVFSEYRARDAFNGRDAEASIGLRNRWAIAPGLLLNTSFERVSPLVQGLTTQTSQNEALAVTGAVEWTKPSLWKTTARLEYRDAFTGDNTLASFGYARKLSRDWTLLGRTLWDDYDAAQRQTRGFSQFGLAWRETDRNRWNALARYEHRFERLGGLGQTLATRDQAHIIAALVNFQPVRRFTFSGRYAGKVANNRVNGIESENTAQLFMARGIMDLSSRLDAGLITSTLFSDGFADRRYGLGGELGLILMKNLRVAGGYNLFGFTDKDLDTMGTTRKGPYLEFGFKFDESIFGIGTPARAGSSQREE